MSGFIIPPTQPLLVVVTGPSGAGKTTLVKRFLAENPDWRFSVSTTTRPPRPGERQGVEYYFVSEEEFERRVRQGLFLEYASVHDHRYGTQLSELERMGSSGLLLDVDVQGGESIRRLRPDALQIFVAPPDVETLQQRLIARGLDNEEQIQIRLQNALMELGHLHKYHYLVINDELERAYEDLAAILHAEPLRLTRRKS